MVPKGLGENILINNYLVQNQNFTKKIDDNRIFVLSAQAND